MTCKKVNPTTSAYGCFKKGIGVGKNLSVPVTDTMSKDVLRHIARMLKVTGYSNMSKQQLFTAITVGKGIKKINPADLVK